MADNYEQYSREELLRLLRERDRKPKFGLVWEALATTHCELVLIHPFREGNGRLSRLLSQLMALQAGLPLLNFSSIKGKQREAYFAAVRAGMGRDYAPMVEIFRKVVKASF